MKKEYELITDQNGDKYQILYYNGRIPAAYINYTDNRTNPWNPMITLEALETRSQYGNQGLATKLLNMVLESYPGEQFILKVVPGYGSGEDYLVSYYERFGFKEVETELEDIVMTKNINKLNIIPENIFSEILDEVVKQGYYTNKYSIPREYIRKLQEVYNEELSELSNEEVYEVLKDTVLMQELSYLI